MIDIAKLREDKRPQSSAIVHALIDRLEAAEKERDDLKAKIEAMERQEPAGWQRLYKDGSSTEDIVDSPNVFIYQRPLYALPGAQTQGEEEEE